MDNTEIKHDLTELKDEISDEFCVLKAEIALEQFIQVKVLNEILSQETDAEQKKILTEFIQEEKDEFTKAKACLDQCMLLNSNYNHNHGMPK